MTVSGDTLVKNEKGGGVSVSVSENNKEQLIADAVNVLIPPQVGDCDEYVEFASRYDDSCLSCYSNDLSALQKDKEGHTIDDSSAAEHRMDGECRKEINVAANKELYVLQRPTVKLMLSTHNRHDRYWTQGK